MLSHVPVFFFSGGETCAGLPDNLTPLIHCRSKLFNLHAGLGNKDGSLQHSRKALRSAHLKLADTVRVGVIDDAAPEPLVGSGAQDVVAAVLQEGLQAEEQSARKDVSEASVAILPFHLSADELLGTAQVELSVQAQVLHQGPEPVGLRVGVVLHKVEPVVLVDVVIKNILDVLEHVPDEPLVAVGDHQHAVRNLAVARAGEEDHVVQVMADGAIDGHAQRVDGVFGGEDPHEEALSYPQLRTDVLSPKSTSHTS